MTEISFPEIEKAIRVFQDIEKGGCGKPIEFRKWTPLPTFFTLDEGLVPKPADLRIDKAIFNGPATIVFWEDGTKTVVKCGSGEVFDREKGLAMAMCKKALGNKGNFNNVFKKALAQAEEG